MMTYWRTLVLALTIGTCVARAFGQGARCGDKECSRGETCASCRADCPCDLPDRGYCDPSDPQADGRGCTGRPAAVRQAQAGPNQPGPGKYSFLHVETGYALAPADSCPGLVSSRFCLANPQFSGPGNAANLDKIEARIQAGVPEAALRNLTRDLERHGKRAMYLSFPYWAKRHPAPLREALRGGHIVGIHMHEDWGPLVFNKSAGQLRDYIASEKKRLEEALGARTYVFSYGPGITLWLREGDRRYSAGDRAGLRKLFKAVADAGFTHAQAAREYAEFFPPGLTPLLREEGYDLEGLTHSFELHTDRGMAGPRRPSPASGER